MTKTSAKSSLPSETRSNMAPYADCHVVPLAVVVKAPPPLTLSALVALAKAAIGDQCGLETSVDD
ncbi:hypothetical protein ACU8MB_16705 [Rhizobium leguminosarum]